MNRHGGSARNLATATHEDGRGGRFGRLLPVEGPGFSRALIGDLAAVMIKNDPGKPITADEPEDENPAIPAGYTYFGQFVDHDITFAPTPLRHQTIEVDGLENLRTPALDLDSVYGLGPDGQPCLYDGLALATGRAVRRTDGTVSTSHDVLRVPPRRPDGLEIAVLGDPRNDENKIVSQMHGAFIALHNRIVKDDAALTKLGGDIATPEGRFRSAVAAARWHYQWVVLHDFLAERVCFPGVVESMLGPGGVPRLRYYSRLQPRRAYVPVEFSGAAYRFGHSMVRPGYALNAEVGTRPDENRIPLFSAAPQPTANLNGRGVALPADWGIDWAFFLDGMANPAGRFRTPQPSYRIDALLVDPLSRLPEFSAGASANEANLAFRNLARGSSLRLPTGEQAARFLGVAPLPADVLWSVGSRIATLVPEAWAETARDRGEVFRKHRAELEGRTPLWYYVLREAEYYGIERRPRDPERRLGGQHLGPVGSRTLAETFLGLLWFDPTSFLHHPSGFRPVLPARVRGRFDLADLLTYALGA